MPSLQVQSYLKPHLPRLTFFLLSSHIPPLHLTSSSFSIIIDNCAKYFDPFQLSFHPVAKGFSDMAYPLYESSLSPAPSMSSSQSLMPINVDDSVMKGLQYRRKEVVDGNCVRISETVRRRRRRGITSRPLPEQNLSNTQYRNSAVGNSKTKSTHIKQSAIVHQTKSSSEKDLLSRTRNDSFIDVSAAVNAILSVPSRGPSENSCGYVELSPPPTPRLQRLPTPDLEPLKAEEFCNCWGCYEISVNSMEHHGQVKKRYCLSSS
jgi:hypothetical protein